MHHKQHQHCCCANERPRDFGEILLNLMGSAEMMVSTMNPDAPISAQNFCLPTEWRLMTRNQRRLLEIAVDVLADAGEIPLERVECRF